MATTLVGVQLAFTCVRALVERDLLVDGSRAHGTRTWLDMCSPAPSRQPSQRAAVIVTRRIRDDKLPRGGRSGWRCEPDSWQVGLVATRQAEVLAVA